MVGALSKGKWKALKRKALTVVNSSNSAWVLGLYTVKLVHNGVMQDDFSVYWRSCFLLKTDQLSLERE